MGIPFLIIGLVFYLLSVYSFIVKGGGTPMIFFMEKTEKIFGKEPSFLVNSFLYKFCRNPMYLGVVITILAVGILVESISILIWMILVFVIFISAQSNQLGFGILVSTGLGAFLYFFDWMDASYAPPWIWVIFAFLGVFLIVTQSRKEVAG